MREVLRAVAQKVAERADPLLRLTARRATLALASTPETATRLANIGARNVRVIASVALHDDEIALLSQASARNGGPFRVVSVGNLLALKGYHLGLAAFARFERVWPGSEYWLIGDGTERHRLEHLARALGVAEKVRFFGALPRSRVLDLLASCNVMLHPCLHESGGYACLEAMGAGLPVVCLDIGGPSLQVTTETGIKVPAHTPEQAEHDLAQALLMLARSPTVCRDMGEAGRARVRQHFRWEGRADLLDQLCASMSKDTVVGTESGAPMPLPGGVHR
jgi:glycosyltransferase involved in cell wall biosynthesis